MQLCHAVLGKPGLQLGKAVKGVGEGLIVLASQRGQQRGIKGEFGQVNAERDHEQPPVQFVKDQVRVRGQPCRVRPGGCRAEILHDLCEHAERRIIPICQTVSWTQDFHDIVIRQPDHDIKLRRLGNLEGTFVIQPSAIESGRSHKVLKTVAARCAALLCRAYQVFH